ncbi:thioredoxin domain-containing protein [bacterium]|jgi:protein-disulfide isomerase|nr:thioredoxin domain-containing protein [bacterium]MBT4649336.1 thioredoxin domain-containing protein [bacterium]
MHKQTKNILFWLASIICLVLLTWGMISLASPNSSNESQSELTTNENIKGNPEATITVVEYSDFQCPACRTYYALTKQLTEDVGDEIKLIYRHFPLEKSHPQARLAATAAEAAALQGKFWEMHDLLFENQLAWSNNDQAEDIFISYAQELGLNTEWFVNDLKSSKVKKKIQSDINNGNLDEVNSTPSFFVNGQKINNPRSYNQFKNAILQFQNK